MITVRRIGKGLSVEREGILCYYIIRMRCAKLNNKLKLNQGNPLFSIWQRSKRRFGYEENEEEYAQKNEDEYPSDGFVYGLNDSASGGSSQFLLWV